MRARLSGSFPPWPLAANLHALTRIFWLLLIALSLSPLAILGACPAMAAAPRDAIKQMPTLSHTSTFNWYSDDDRTENPDYVDTYTGTWELEWRPREFDIGSATAKLEFTYKLTLKDILDRYNNFSSDLRYEQWFAKASLNARREMQAHFQLDQQDTYGNSYPAQQPRSWTAISDRQAGIDWQRDGWPQVSIFHQTANTSNYLGLEPIQASDSELNRFALLYKRDHGICWQQYSVTSEMTRTNNFTNGTGQSIDNTIFDAQRELRFGDIGKLNLGANFNENAKRDFTGQKTKISTSSRYTLALTDGRTGGPLPLTYGIKYNVLQLGLPEQLGNQQVQREVALGFKPPMGDGKSASLDVTQSYDEFESASNSTGSGKTAFTWQINPNPRTGASLIYSNEYSVDRREQTRSNNKEIVQTILDYRTPGSKTTYHLDLSQAVTRRQEYNRSVNNIYNLSSTFNLGPGTSVRMFYNQFYTDNYRDLYSQPSGNDQTISGVTYNANNTKKSGLNLSATWQLRQDRSKQTGIKKTTELINLLLKYQTQANWQYSLNITTSAATDPSANSPLGYNYTTNDNIIVTVFYNF